MHNITLVIFLSKKEVTVGFEPTSLEKPAHSAGRRNHLTKWPDAETGVIWNYEEKNSVVRYILLMIFDHTIENDTCCSAQSTNCNIYNTRVVITLFNIEKAVSNCIT